MNAYADQPAPVSGGAPVRPEAERLFAEVLAYQCAKGESKHGGPLCTNNGRNPLMDALGEMVDGFQYVVQALIERDALIAEVERLRAESAALRVEKDAAIEETYTTDAECWRLRDQLAALRKAGA